MITVIIPCHKRFNKLGEIINRWLNQPGVNELLVLNNSGAKLPEMDLKYPNRIFEFRPEDNVGPQGKYPLALYATNECIVFGDDDILTDPGLTNDLSKHWDENTIVSVLGRIFDGNSYYTSSGYRGENLTDPLEADWVGGGCTMTHRKHCAVNVADCPHFGMDDIWWQQVAKQRNSELKFLIAPTNKYHFTKDDKDENALHLDPQTKKLREKYYKEWGLGRDK